MLVDVPSWVKKKCTLGRKLNSTGKRDSIQRCTRALACSPLRNIKEDLQLERSGLVKNFTFVLSAVVDICIQIHWLLCLLFPL